MSGSFPLIKVVRPWQWLSLEVMSSPSREAVKGNLDNHLPKTLQKGCLHWVENLIG